MVALHTLVGMQEVRSGKKEREEGRIKHNGKPSVEYVLGGGEGNKSQLGLERLNRQGPGLSMAIPERYGKLELFFSP